MFDLIGDIHGNATRLERLLRRLGYENRNGAWRHPDREVIFLGDFVDRGPEQVEAVNIARSMVDAGSARAIMGNHEFNAVAFATPDPDAPGEYLRPRTEKNRHQHRAFLEQVGEDSALHAELVEWFRTLPVYLELEGLRAVHACWHPERLARLQPLLDERGAFAESAWFAAARKGTEAYEAAETVLKGLEIELPEGYSFPDKDGVTRHEIRTRWWDLEAVTYKALAMVPEGAEDELPDLPVPEGVLPGYDNAKPLFFGHYWLKGEPSPMSDHIACLDYSAVDPAPEGKLTAYRWDGEHRLDPARFIWV